MRDYPCTDVHAQPMCESCETDIMGPSNNSIRYVRTGDPAPEWECCWGAQGGFTDDCHASVNMVYYTCDEGGECVGSEYPEDWTPKEMD